MEMHNIHDAKTHLSKLIERVAAGEKIVIAKAGKPMAVLSAYEEGTKKKKQPRKGGGWEGKVWMSEDFDTYIPEEFAEYIGTDTADANKDA